MIVLATTLSISVGAVSQRPIYYPTNLARKAKLDPITITLSGDGSFNSVVLYCRKILGSTMSAHFNLWGVGGNNLPSIYNNQTWEIDLSNHNIFSGEPYEENNIFEIHGVYEFYAQLS